MLHFEFILFLLASQVAAVPLNINLGAYSPALVVGDGEISFGAGGESVTNLMNALEGAAVSAAATNAGGAKAAEPARAVEAAKPSTSTVAAAAVTSQADKSTAEAIATMQSGAGLGNDIEPRIRSRSMPEIDEREIEEIQERAVVAAEKRDLAGFDRALNFAATALTTAPKVSLGTGEKGSGVGIIQEAGINNGGPKAATPAGAGAKLKRSDRSKRTKVTTMFVRDLASVVECELSHPPSKLRDGD
jgi:hypothetical protein